MRNHFSSRSLWAVWSNGWEIKFSKLNWSIFSFLFWIFLYVCAFYWFGIEALLNFWCLPYIITFSFLSCNCQTTQPFIMIHILLRLLLLAFLSIFFLSFFDKRHKIKFHLRELLCFPNTSSFVTDYYHHGGLLRKIKNFYKTEI